MYSKKAIDLAHDAYAITGRFPKEERFGLTSRIRHAVVSISSNIAEGSGRRSDKDFAHFIEIAYGSLMEVVSQMQVACRQAWLAQGDWDDLYAKAGELARMLSGLRASLVRQPS